MNDPHAPLLAATATAIQEGPAATSAELRQALARGEPPPELVQLVEKIRAHAYRVTDQDIDALRGKYNEDELFEIIVASTQGAAEYRFRAAMNALEGA